MSEYHDAFIDGVEEDPRTQLADVLRGFFLRAIDEQDLRDAESGDSASGKKQPGSLYKTDGGFLKIHLQPPASDVIFNGTYQPPAETGGFYPDIWVLIPWTSSEETAELRDVVMVAESLLLHTRVPGHEHAEFWVRDDFIGPSEAEEIDLEKLTTDTHHDEEGRVVSQQAIASGWVSLLSRYDIRTIAATDTGETAA